MSVDPRFNPQRVPIELHCNGDQAALFIDGKLVSGPGDDYHCNEYLQCLLGVRVVDDDAFLRGADGREGHARDLDEVYQRVAAREANLKAAAEKITKARRLLAEARQLDPHARLDHRDRH